jgi:hypothetical protein
MSSTWEEPGEDAPPEWPSPSDAPTGKEGEGKKTGEGEIEQNQEEDPPA